jgi:hypothetical protein
MLQYYTRSTVHQSPFFISTNWVDILVFHSNTMSRRIGALIGHGISPIVESLDVNAIVNEIDLNEVLQKVDVDRLVGRPKRRMMYCWDWC